MADNVTAAYSGRGEAFTAPEEYIGKSYVPSRREREELYRRAELAPDAFWLEQAETLSWVRKPTRAGDYSFHAPDVHIRWFEDGVLNACYNCVDRHLKARADTPALLFEPDNPLETGRIITYRTLYQETVRLAGVLKRSGIRKGDRVMIYLPMIPEAVYAMLACARIGAVHSVVFAGFSPDSLADRVLDCNATAVITADEGLRGGRPVPLKKNVDKALERCPGVRQVLVVQRTGADVPMKPGRDMYYSPADAPLEEVPPEPMEAEAPLFILYTSGSTGKPKGVVHTTGGYLVHCAYTHKYVFDYHDGDIYWCTADVGWVTGHSYIVYGPLANGATQVLFEGTPQHPSPARFWQVVDKYRVNILYTAPTAIRALMREGDSYIEGSDLGSLRLLGSVGEPINPEAWRWYQEKIGKGRCPIVDTWWQTETGGILIAPLPGAVPQKPGSATLPLPGIHPALFDTSGRELSGEAEGLLVMKKSWPGQARTVYGDHGRFVQTYFSQIPGVYYTGDGCRRDADGYYWITGRVDDVLNISGHRIGTAEIESALVAHPLIAEAAVVGFPHEIKGQGIYCYVTLIADVEPGEQLRAELVEHVRKQIGGIAKPDQIQFTPGLPKTRSGKIMRRILRKIAANETHELGDTSTLADQGVVQELIEHRLNR